MTNAAVGLLFVYGSLRSGFKSPAYEYISRYFNLLGNAKVHGLLHDMGAYPAGTPSSDGFIIGELYEVKDQEEFSWALAQLDDYEGVNTEAGETQLFRRAVTPVFFNDNTLEAWIYWYNGSVEGKPVITSGDLMDYIRRS